MSFDFVYLGLSCFALSWLVHLVWWRIATPRGEIKPLFACFLLLPLAVLALLAWVYPVVGLLESGLAATLHLAFAVVYIQTYPAIATEIPSFRLLRLVEAAEPKGADAAQLAEQIGAGELVGSRSDLLYQDGLVEKGPEGLRLKGAGRLLAQCFTFYRRFLGLGEGGG